MKKAVICIVQRHDQADAIVAQLRSSGFSPHDISVLLPDKQGTADFAHEHNTKAPEGAVAGAGTGGVLGGAVGLLAGIGALAIPGLGPFIAAGPLMGALSGAAIGAGVGGLTGALIGMGIPEIEARKYEGKIKGGNLLIATHVETTDQHKRVEAIYRMALADDISSIPEKAVPNAQPESRR
jgi:hypothetical protein